MCESTGQPKRKYGWQWHRRIYDWVLHWADTRYGTPALCGLSFAESSFFPIPPDVLLIALALGNRSKALWFALWCSVASVLGGLLGYYIGQGLLGPVVDWIIDLYDLQPQFAKIEDAFEIWGFWFVFVAGFTPIPYKAFTIGAGLMAMNVPMFLLASAASRSARFFLVAWLIKRFGPTIEPFIDRYFNLLCIVFTVLLVGGVVLIKWLR